MRFCPDCENLLITKSEKLYCRACDVYFELPSDRKEEIVFVKTIKHDEKDFDTAMIIGKLENRYVTQDDRKAYEDFFSIEQEI